MFTYLYLALDFMSNCLWIIISILLFVIILINPHPLLYKQDSTFLEILLVFIRRFVLIAIVFLVVLLPTSLGLFYSINEDVDKYISWYLHVFYHYSGLIIFSFIFGFIVKILYARHLIPYLSNLFRRYRVKLNSDKLSDIRDEKSKYRKKQFNPVDYYKADNIFLGLDLYNKPVYIPLEDWLETNMQIIGPTRFGKGILMGVQIDQAIRNGYCVVYIDPKGDKNIPYIMANRAEEMQREFVYCDLNEQGNLGSWHPFNNGSNRAKRARILTAFGLENTGNESDFYKINERQVLDKIMPQTTRIKGLIKTIRDNDLEENSKRLLGGLIEWAKIKSLNPSGKGLSIEKCLLDNAVVYIKGSLDDKVIRDATRILIMEIIQEASRLEKQRKNHLTLVIDELRFLTSNAVVDATATFAGFNANMILAYQSVKDIRNLEDRNIDALSAETSINTNCQMKFIYGSQDVETCEWAENMSGNMQKLVTQRELTSIGSLGEETWEKQRAVGEKAEAYVTKNTMLSLEKRAGVLFLPSELPKIVFTCFVPTNRN